MGRISRLYAEQNAPPPGLDAVLSGLAVDQYGVFTVGQAAGIGVSADMLCDRVKRGTLFRVHRGVYSLVPPRLLSANGHRMAAVLAAGVNAGAGLSHVTAGVHTGFLKLAAPTILDVTIPSRGGHKRPGLHIHRSATLRPRDVQLVYKIPTTTVARTVLDLLGTLSTQQVEEAMDEAARMDLVSVNELKAQVAHNRGRPEAARLHALVEGWEAIWSLTDSQLEKLVLQGLDAQGLARPELQQWLDLNDGGQRIRADFLYRDARLILEADSKRWHAHRLEQDSQRDQRTAAAGFQTIRITRRQVVDDLDRLAGTVRAVHAERTALFSLR